MCVSQLDLDHMCSAEIVVEMVTARGIFLGPSEAPRPMSSLRTFDLCNAENADRIAESSHSNVIYSITQNVMQFGKFCVNVLIAQLYT